MPPLPTRDDALWEVETPAPSPSPEPQAPSPYLKRSSNACLALLVGPEALLFAGVPV